MIERSWIERHNYYLAKAEQAGLDMARAEVRCNPAHAQWHRDAAVSFRRQAEAVRQEGLKYDAKQRKAATKPRSKGVK